MATTEPTALRFLWWNAQDFAHYDKQRARAEHRPQSEPEFQEKLRRVGAVLQATRQPLGGVDLIGLGEATRPAVEQLRDAFFANYRVFSAAADPTEFQVVWLVAPELPIYEQPPIRAPDMSRHTRPMPALDLQLPGGRVRFVGCHWPAFEESGRSRERLADHLVHELYEFLVKNRPLDEFRHAVVLGDLNDEPFGVPLSHLNAHRARGLARSAPAWQDHDARRVHLYNCAWRLLGERHPHGGDRPPDHIEAAGTWYSAEKKRWATLDHVIVSEGLLTASVPRLDESSVQVLTHKACAPSGDVPHKFSQSGGTFRGVSDHLPILGRLVLAE